jgi:integrase
MKNMKPTYRLYQRKSTGVYYLQNNSTREQRSLHTKDEATALKLLSAENQPREQASLNMEIGVAYISHADPQMATRTWQTAMDEFCSRGQVGTQARCARELKSPAYDIIRNKPIIKTTAEDLKAVLKRGGAITNNYLRRLHNLALDNGWIHKHIIPPKKWEKVLPKAKRGITLDEHQRIIAVEKNEERRNYYEMLWLIGSAQSDCANMTAEKVDWQNRVLSYARMKTRNWCHLSIGTALDALLKKLPKSGFLFPHIAQLSNKDRAAEFCRRCRLLKINGVSLHSYRYAWAERAYASGYEERFAQAALGHKNRAVHHAYAKRAVVVCPPLEDCLTFTAQSGHETKTAVMEMETLTA